MISGFINVYKEAGFTSHDVVAKLRGIVHQKKIGHTGTLDPDAVGVLPVCLGRATRLADVIAGDTKTYETVLLLGKETDTQDISGRVLEEREVTCTKEEFRQILPRFLGEQEQIPPMYSARKQDGKKLYELARKGITVERKPSTICVDKLEVLSLDLPRAALRITCSKGTYIRTLCHDIGKALGCGGCMEKLTRTQVGPFRIEEAHTLSEIEKAAREGTLDQYVLAPDSFFSDLPACSTGPETDRLAENGNGVPASLLAQDVPGTKNIRLYHSDGAFLGVYYYRQKEDMYFPRWFLYEGQQQDSDK